MKNLKRFVLFTLMLPFAPLANARSSVQCGLYQRLTLINGQTSVTLTDYQSAPLQGTEYTILNPLSAIVVPMISGYCYCVQGTSQQNTNYPDDSFFRWLTVEEFIGGPFFKGKELMKHCQPQ